jgi:predicted CXXCH cytochrome family protein
MARSRGFKFALSAIVVIGALLFRIYRLVIWEGSSAREPAPALETGVATWLLSHTVPASYQALKNPLDDSAGSADVAAGQLLYQGKCVLCHGYDGGGRTEVAGNEYPRPPPLRGDSVQKLRDGEIFYHVKNGIRHTGMPAWDLPDQKLWQLVAYLRHLPKVAAEAAPAAQLSESARYLGSGACKDCHAEIYQRWKQTRMANVVVDPKARPEVIIPDLAKPDPLLTFTRDDIALTYGSRWKQRYFKRVGDDYFVLPAQWDVSHKMWRPYFVKNGTDWWTAHYPPDNFQRPTGPLCDGCHSVNYDTANKTVTEWNVGCERCHGPGSEHVANPHRPAIVNPARLGYVEANDVCIQCHSQGQPLSNPIQGRYFDWPVGYRAGMPLAKFWKLEEHRLGDTTFTHFADGSAHKNRMQGNDFVQSLMYTRGVACFSCHDAHGTKNDGMLWKPTTTMCLDCHGPNAAVGPRAASIEAHTHHQPGSPGSECVACHMPKIAQTIADVNVRSHTFRFITPALTEAAGVPNACTLCHADKPASWAATALNSWHDRSPWRMAQ